MAYPNEGTLVTDEREIAISETWETQTDWEAYQSLSNVVISNGVVMLEQFAIPDSAIAHYDAQALTGSDGSTITTWSDELGNYDATGGSPTIQDGSINGNRALYFDGNDDVLTATNPTFSQPNTVFAVAQMETTTNGNIVSSDDNNARNQLDWDTNNSAWRMYAGTSQNGSSDDTIQLFSAVFDGASSILRENGTQTLAADVGTIDQGNIRIGAEEGPSRYFQGWIGEIVWCNGRVSDSDIQSEEQRLADKWGITL